MAFHPKISKYTIFSSVHRTFSQRIHMLGHQNYNKHSIENNVK